MKFHSFSTEFGKADPLFRAIFSCDKEQTELLKKQGAVLSESLRSTLVNGCRFLISNKPESDFMLNYMVDLGEMTAEEFLFAIPRLYAETGEPMNCTAAMIHGLYEFKGIYDILLEPNVFKCFMECFDQRKLGKALFMQDIIDKDRADMLALCAEHGWIKRSVKCDELIEYSSKRNSVECTAYLLDYKNRSFDLAAERKKAEKREMRELSGSPDKAKKPRVAAPGSSAAMRTLWRFGKNAEGTITVSGYKGDSTEIVIPEKIGDDIVTRLKVDMMLGGTVNELFAPSEIRKSVTKITLPKTITSLEDHIFEEFSALDEIYIPDGVTKIGNFAFCGCESLKRVRLPDSLTGLGEDAFWGCVELSEIDIPNGAAEIGKKAFCGCKKLKRLTLPDSITKIGFGAFIDCSELSEINIPSGITELPGSALAGCEKLRSYEIPETVQIIGEHAFNGCKSITAAKIPHGIAKIDRYTFANCEMLESVKIPDTVEKIGEHAFVNCKSLKTLVIPEGVTEIGFRAFAECPKLECIELPNSLSKAKNVTGNAVMTIFDQSPNVTAVVYPKSYAERYCKKNKIPFAYKE